MNDQTPESSPQQAPESSEPSPQPQDVESHSADAASGSQETGVQLTEAASGTETGETEKPSVANPPSPGPLSSRASGPLAQRKVSPTPAAAEAPSKPKSNPSGRPGSPPPSFERNREGIPQEGDEARPAEGSAGESKAPTGGTPPKRSGGGKEKDKRPKNKQIAPPPKPKVAVPNKRAPLGDDLEALLEQELSGSEYEDLLGGQAGMPMREPLQDGQRVHATVIKKSPDSVFVSLGGPDEGAVPHEQFKEEPEIGSAIEVVVRGFNSEDGLYNVVIPGQAIEASDWDDLEEGSVVEAFVSGTCNGGVEVKVGSIRGFIPISQLSEFRVEDATEFVDKKLMCVVNECNPKLKNLVLSHRAILEREREERRQEQLEKIEVGDTLEGVVRNVRDFGAFVDLGGVEGLIHVSKLSWDRIKHPSEVIEEGQKVKVKIEKIDKESGKIGLSYRDLLEDPWDGIDAKFPIGSLVNGVISRVADFGAFVRLGTGIEGLIHISELAHHRVVRVTNIVNEGDEVEVKILTVDAETQRIGLSMKAAQAKPESETDKANQEEEVEEPPREPCIKRSHSGPLKGGTDNDRGGAQFGLKW